MSEEVIRHNREAWDRQVEKGNQWTIPVSPQEIAAAKRGEWSVVLTPRKPVPHDWFPPMDRLKVLCLASAGGQQAPILAAAGAAVWSLDASKRQLDQDRLVALRDGLVVKIVQGDMADLGVFGDAFFDLVFHPVSNCFAPNVRAVWREAHRVLRGGGRLLSGFVNPLLYMFDDEIEPGNQLVVKHSIPYSDLETLSLEEKRQFERDGSPLEFGHTLDDQIGGQLAAGFSLLGFYEDRDHEDQHPLHGLTSTFIATLAVKTTSERVV
jgi:SAM-dependent methyltransferase